jgi:hypothetical protein
MILDDSWYCENLTCDCGVKFNSIRFPQSLGIIILSCSFYLFPFLVLPLNFCCRAPRFEISQFNLDVSVWDELFRYLGFPPHFFASFHFVDLGYSPISTTGVSDFGLLDLFMTTPC